MLSLGGWIGGALVTFGAPVAFDTHAEYPLLLAAFAVVFARLRGRRMLAWWRDAPLWQGGPRLAVLMTLIALTGFGVYVTGNQGNLDHHRTFYGTYRVSQQADDDGLMMRTLHHGRTLHGAEIRTGPLSGRPISYYHPSQCISEVHDIVGARRRGILGLGAGVAAAFNRPDGSLHFYEIDGDNEAIARRWFSYLDAAPGHVEVRVGDGRLELAQRDDVYDLLMMDAFSETASPCTSSPTRRWGPTSIASPPTGSCCTTCRIATTTSSPSSAARSPSAAWAAAIHDERGQTLPDHAHRAECIVISRDSAALQPFVDRGWVVLEGQRETHLWTDDYVDLLSALWRRLSGS